MPNLPSSFHMSWFTCSGSVQGARLALPCPARQKDSVSPLPPQPAARRQCRASASAASARASTVAAGSSARRRRTTSPTTTRQGASIPARSGRHCRLGQRGLDHALGPGGGVADERHRCLRREPAPGQPLGDGLELAERHVEDQHRRAVRDGLPVERVRHAAGRVVAGQQRHRRVGGAMGHGDAGRRQAAGSGGDARHEAKGDAGCGERQRLLPAPAEDEGIAALEAEHALPLPREPNQPAADVGLARGRLAAPLAGVFERGPRPGQRQNLGRDQSVVDDAIGLSQRVCGMQREQARIAGGRRPRATPSPAPSWAARACAGEGEESSIAALYTG